MRRINSDIKADSISVSRPHRIRAKNNQEKSQFVNAVVSLEWRFISIKKLVQVFAYTRPCQDFDIANAHDNQSDDLQNCASMNEIQLTTVYQAAHKGTGCSDVLFLPLFYIINVISVSSWNYKNRDKLMNNSSRLLT